MPPSLHELGLDRLSPEDRLAVAEAIWESVAQEAETAPLSPARRAELDRRLAESIANPTDVIPWEEIWDRSADSSGGKDPSPSLSNDKFEA